MGALLSIQLPTPLSNLVTQEALDNYTVSGPVPQLKTRLRGLTVDDLFPAGIDDSDLAQCCLSGLWLLHNFLNESHEISQDIHSREGSFWHGIMHRLEGDFWNSKYWYQKVGNHPVYNSISTKGKWDPGTYVDQCEAARDSSGEAARVVQQTAVAEWKALFEYCFSNASK